MVGKTIINNVAFDVFITKDVEILDKNNNIILENINIFIDYADILKKINTKKNGIKIINQVFVKNTIIN